MKSRQCPLCGKPMWEQPKWRGVWMCEGYRHALNNHPPYKYECTGIHMTRKAMKDFDKALLEEYIKRN